jgi:hypothetical protein
MGVAALTLAEPRCMRGRRDHTPEISSAVPASASSLARCMYSLTMLIVTADCSRACSSSAVQPALVTQARWTAARVRAQCPSIATTTSMSQHGRNTISEKYMRLFQQSLTSCSSQVQLGCCTHAAPLFELILRGMLANRRHRTANVLLLPCQRCGACPGRVPQQCVRRQ